MRSPLIPKLLLLLSLVGCQLAAFPQVAKITGVAKNLPAGKIFLIHPGYDFMLDNVSVGYQETIPNKKGAFSISVHRLTEPQIMKANFVDSSGKSVGYNLFLSPGDQLEIKYDKNSPENKFIVTGKGSKNNQPLDIYGNDDSIYHFFGDTLPGRIINYLESLNTIHKKTLLTYIQQQQPSPEFIAAWNTNLQYEVVDAYFHFASDIAPRIREAYRRNYDKWNDLRTALFDEAPLLNEEALRSPNYRNLLDFYLLRTKESLWTEAEDHRSDFLLKWYGKDTARGAESFADDKSNDLQQRIIEKQFSGKVKEYLYAVLIQGSIAGTRR